MTKKLIVFVILVLTAIPAFAETIVDTAWVRRYSGPGNGNDAATAIAIDGSGNVYVTGGSYDIGTSGDYATIKYYPNGDTAWLRRYNGPGNDYDQARAIAVDDSGNVYVTGSISCSGSSSDCATIKYYPNGDTAWVRRYNGPGNNADFALAIAIDGSHNVYITGGSYIGSYDDFVTIKYDPNGDTAWARMYNGPADRWDYAKGIVVDYSGNVYVTGDSWNGALKEDCTTIKYDPNGNQLWVRRYNGPGNGEDHASAIAVDDSSNIYVTGPSDGGGGNDDYATIKYYPNGDTAWLRRYNGPGNGEEYAYAIAVDRSGNVCVTGYSRGSDVNSDYATIKYYPNGDTAWVRRYNGPGNDSDGARAIALDDSGNISVTGWSYSSGADDDYATIKYYPNGDTAWVRRYNGPGNSEDGAQAIAVDASGNVYVTGYSEGSETGYDYATIKYVRSSFEPSPHVISTSPTQNQLNVPVNTNISVTFDLDMDLTTINDSTFVVNAWSTGLHQGAITYDSPTKTATLNPTNDFDEGEIVTVVLTTGIKSSVGTPMESSYVWSFTTKVDDGTACFTPPFSYDAGTGPVSVFSADLDGDWDLDLVVANSGGNNVSILKNNGDGTFQTKVDYGSGGGPFSVFCADLDGDIDLDLAVANYDSNNVSILENNSDGTFQTKVDYGAGDYPCDIFCSDLDGDGDLDLAVANGLSQFISILLNNGDGIFQNAVNYVVGGNPWSVSCGDLDGDGDLDLVAANDPASVSILMNNGDGTFQTNVDYATGIDAGSFSSFCADLDGDGDLDIAVGTNYSYGSSAVYILKNQGDGTFLVDYPYGIGYMSSSIFCADLDGDSDLDIAVTDYYFATVTILENNGSGSFQIKAYCFAGGACTSVFCADLDRDGDLDFAASKNASPNVSILLNIRRGDCSGDRVIDVGDVVFLINYLFKNSPAPVPLPVGDVNCDGVDDVGDVVYLINYLFKSGPTPCC